jgi:hypothetical protein
LKKNLALAALALVLLLGAAQSSNSVSGQLNAIQSQLNDVRPRKFYLTKITHTGDQALSACAAGYHMASLFEIHDPTNLRYNTELGITSEDSGFGPPKNFGWIRTGYDASTVNLPGVANCNKWMSASATDSGSVVAQTTFWSEPSAVSPVAPWIPGVVTCSSQVPVWCVQD